MSKFKFPAKKTRVVATIGPASNSPAMIEKLITAGMNVARINFAHGTLDAHRAVIQTLRSVASRLQRRIAILGDLPGPKMRIGKLHSEPIRLERDQVFTLQVGDDLGDQTHAFMDFARLAQAVKPGDSIFLDDGYIQLGVEQVVGDAVRTRVIVGGELRSHKGVNFPGIDLGISAFTEQDHNLLRFAAEQRLDAVSQSFVSTANDLATVRNAAQALGYAPLIIAKIERAGAVQNIDAILEVCDGIMVARGDLGVEMPIEEVAAVQKEIILRAKLAAKPIITATQMLESMIHNRRPTRAEVSDVTNAILDGSDAVMLSGETAIGDYPEACVAMMTRIAQVAERMPDSNMLGEVLQTALQAKAISLEDHVSLSTYLTAQTMAPDLIFAVTASGGTARRLARFRQTNWIIAFSPNEATCQQLQFVRGVYTVHVPEYPASWADFARKWVSERSLTAELGILTEGGGTLRTRGATRLEMIDLQADAG
jgi:pyruvate kinase